MEIDDDDVPRATRLLASMIHLSGKQRQEIDRKLGASRGFTSQLLTGRIQLKYSHIVKIMRALEVDPSVFFRILFPERSDARTGKDLLHQFLEQLYGPAGAAAPPPPPAAVPAPPASNVNPAAIGKLVEEAVARALSGLPPEGKPPRRGGAKRKKA